MPDRYQLRECVGLACGNRLCRCCYARDELTAWIKKGDTQGRATSVGGLIGYCALNAHRSLLCGDRWRADIGSPSLDVQVAGFNQVNVAIDAGAGGPSGSRLLSIVA